MNNFSKNNTSLANLLENKFIEATNNEKIKTIKEWQELDNKILRTRSKVWQVKDFRSRMIWTPQAGIIRFRRRRYINKITKKCKFLLDEKIKLPERIFILPEHRALALFYYRVYRSYKEVALNIFGGYASKMSIHRFIKEQEDNFMIQKYKCNNDGILWINADGLWQKLHHTQDRDKIEIKNFCFFTGRSFQNNDRYKLDGRILKHFIDMSVSEITDEVEKIAYSYEDVREIRIIGDGARWIKSIAKNLGATYYIDKFHIHKALRDLVGKENYYHGLKIITNYKLSKKQIKYELLKLIADIETGEINTKYIKNLGYIVNNHDAYLRSQSDFSRGVIESMHSHYIAKYIKNRRKGFNPKILNILINSFTSFANGGWKFIEGRKQLFEFDIGNSSAGKNVPVLNSGLAGSKTYRSIQALICK